MRTVIRRDILALVPRVDAHPTHAVVDGVTYPGGLAEYRAAQARADRMDAEDRQRLPFRATRQRIARLLSAR